MAKLLFAALLGVMCTAALALAKSNSPDERTVPVGAVDTINLDFDPEPKISVANRSVVEVLPGAHPRELKVVPLKKGTTSVLIFKGKGKLQHSLVYKVISNDTFQKLQAVRHLLRDIEGISVDATENQIVVDGALLDPRDMDRILKVQLAYKENVLVMVTISPLVLENRARLMEKMITSDTRGKKVKVRVENGTVMLLGEAETIGDSKRAEAIAQTYLPETLSSPAIRSGALIQGARKYSILNRIEVKNKGARSPASQGETNQLEFQP